jgi:hypothetical protein
MSNRYCQRRFKNPHSAAQLAGLPKLPPLFFHYNLLYRTLDYPSSLSKHLPSPPQLTRLLNQSILVDAMGASRKE